MAKHTERRGHAATADGKCCYNYGENGIEVFKKKSVWANFVPIIRMLLPLSDLEWAWPSLAYAYSTYKFLSKSKF